MKFITLFFSLLTYSIQAQVNVYVATTGNDVTGNGSIMNPYSTLTKAGAVLYALNNGATNKTIFLRGGSYYNANVMLWNGRHDNLTLQSYPGESAILYGGQPLTNWTSIGGGIWTAPLGVFPSSVTNVSTYNYWCPRTLLVNGNPAKWAELPLRYTSQVGTSLVYTNEMSDTTNNELSLDLSWSDVQRDIVSIDTATRTITMSQSVSRGANTGDVKSYYLRNGPEGMLVDNSYWWDKTNLVVYYRPPAGIDPNIMSIIVPTTTRIIYGYGYSLSSVCSNMVFSNLTFACTTSFKTSSGDAGAYNGYGAIHLGYPTNCIIDGCSFYGMGGFAIGASSSSLAWGNTIRNCRIRDCGGAGIVLGGNRTTISNNLIYNCGLITYAGVGIKAGSEGLVCNNTITNCNGAGIFIQAYNTNSIIRDNWIQRCVKKLRDMGAIYGGENSGLVIMHNYVADITGTNSSNGGPWDWFLHGIYNDYNSYNATVVSNIVFNCSRPLHNNDAINAITYINNVTVNLTPNEKNWLFWNGTNQNRLASKNIFFGQTETAIRSGVTAYNPNLTCADWRTNIMWAVNGNNSANPTNAVTADPLFVNTASDWSFQAGSPAPGLGIQPLSLAGIGYNSGPVPPRQNTIRAVTARVGTIRMVQ